MDEVYYLKEIGPYARDGILLGILIGMTMWAVLVRSRRTVDLRRFSVVAAIPFSIASCFALASIIYAKYDMLVTEGILTTSVLLIFSAWFGLVRGMLVSRTTSEAANWLFFSALMVSGMIVFGVGSWSHESLSTVDWGVLMIGTAAGVFLANMLVTLIGKRLGLPSVGESSSNSHGA